MAMDQIQLRPRVRSVPPSAANAIDAWDVYRPDLMELWPSRSFTTGKYFATAADVGGDSTIAMSSGTNTKFAISCWMRIDWPLWTTTFTSGLGDQFPFFGLQSFDFGWTGWLVRPRLSSTLMSLDLQWGTGTGSTNAAMLRFLRAVDSDPHMFGTSASTSPRCARWHHFIIFGDGALAGAASDNPTAVECYFNGVKQVTQGTGTAFPAKYITPAAGHNVKFFVNHSAHPMPWSFMNLAVCQYNDASLPGTRAQAAASAWNNGRPLTHAQWLAASATLPAPFLHYTCKDNQNLTTGAPPSGNLVNEANPGTYDLVATGAPPGEHQVAKWAGSVNSKVQVFGYTRTFTNGRAGYWGRYLPAGRNGKPCVYGRPQVSNTVDSGIYAMCPYADLQDVGGTNGALISNFIVGFKGATTNDINPIALYDDVTGVGGSGCRRNLSISLIGYNAYSNPTALGTVTFEKPGGGALANGDIITVRKTSHGRSVGDIVWFTSDAGGGVGPLPAPLKAYPYYASNADSSAYSIKTVPDANTFTLAIVTNEVPIPTAAITSVGGTAGTGAPVTCYYNTYSNTVCAFKPALQVFSGSGQGPGYDNLAIGREYNHYGIELPGVPSADMGYGAAIYPAIGQEVTIEVGNDGSGVFAPELAPSPNGPFYMRINGARQPLMWHDGGGSGQNQNYWIGYFTALSGIALGGGGTVDGSGVQLEGHTSGEHYWGRQVLTLPDVPDAVRLGLHNWARK